jgi:hypothetical protein
MTANMTITWTMFIPLAFFKHNVPGTQSVCIIRCEGTVPSPLGLLQSNLFHCMQWPKWVGIFSSLHLMTETDPAPEMLFEKCQGGGQ